MYSYGFLLICVQACLLQTVFSNCGCGYSALPAINYGSSCGIVPSATTVEYGVAVPSSFGGCSEVGLGIGSAGLYSSPRLNALPSAASAGAGSYGGAGTGQVGVAGDVGASGNTVVVGSVPVLGAVDFSGRLPAAGSVTISGQCDCGCGCY